MAYPPAGSKSPYQRGEQYARLRLQQMVRAGFLRELPVPGPGGYGAIWRSVSRGLNERAQARGYSSSLQALRSPYPTQLTRDRSQPFNTYYDPISAGLVGQALAPGYVASHAPNLNFNHTTVLNDAIAKARSKTKRDLVKILYGLGA